jgi:DDE superfamily endonuclease
MAIQKCPAEWLEWSEYLAAGLHGRCRWRLPILFFGILFATGRQTAASWLRAAGVSRDFQDYYYFISAVGRKVNILATRLLLLLLKRLPSGDHVLFAIDDTPTKRYGPKVQGAGIHHNPTPGPADAKFLYGHIWVTLAWVARHPLWGTIGLPLRAALYIRQKDISRLPEKLGWKFQTKLQQGAALAFWAWMIVADAGKRLWLVADGAYAKRPFLKPLRLLGVVVISRLRKDAALHDLPRKRKKGQRRGRGRPATYGKNRISLAKRAAARRGWRTIECVQYGKTVTKQYKTFPATYHPACGMIRVVIVQERDGCEFFFSTDPEASVREILEAFPDRATIEQVFHDIKEVWGAGKQQLRHLWANFGAYHLNLWAHTLVELWAWNKSTTALCDRSASPWDDPTRRPSHADRRKALRRKILRAEFSAAASSRRLPRKIRDFIKQLLGLAC